MCNDRIFIKILINSDKKYQKCSSFLAVSLHKVIFLYFSKDFDRCTVRLKTIEILSSYADDRLQHFHRYSNNTILTESVKDTLLNQYS